jgi:NitT/TauT family transport system permease protein
MLWQTCVMTPASIHVRETSAVVARLRARALDLVPFVLVVAGWWAVTALKMTDPIFLPTPGATARSFMGLLNTEFLRENLGPSFVRVGGAFLLSAAIAVPVGVLSTTVPLLQRLVLPLCSFMRYLPVPALVPLCILWFGIDDAQKIGVITIGSVFQLLMLVAADTEAVPTELVETSRTLGLSPRAVIWRVVLPWAMPAIWNDLRVCAGWAWSYLILAELVAGNRGVGYFIVQAQRYLETERVFAGVLLVGVLGLITDVLFRVAGRRLFRWM